MHRFRRQAAKIRLRSRVSAPHYLGQDSLSLVQRRGATLPQRFLDFRVQRITIMDWHVL
jgi:hypothetical protein